ncbi:hypothetical protein LTR37_015351 [Vermiconidia calcicola]|uniref:Uncharacterized protein n=1 Tax=Vermiconidia calcicola TaxID=1690605 RepID=A0ACC3MR58_9PEZI|nr:hypothetical protein LTR37_015351 [Vermiconidia calcicola]
MASSLTSLPPELLELVADCIESPEDWSALRLTSRRIQDATRRAWTERFFWKRDVFLDRQSLSKLVDISMTANIARTVRCIYIQCEDDSRYLDYPASEKTFSPEPPSRLEPNEVLSLLLLALPNLGNLTLVCFRDAEDTHERRDDEVPDWGNIVRFTSAFNQVLSAVEESGLCPKAIAPLPSMRDTRLGIMDCSILSQTPRCLSKIEEFRTSVLVDTMGAHVAPRLSGSEFGQQLVAVMRDMTTWRGDIDFPGMRAKVYDSEENEDGYVEVYDVTKGVVELEGIEQVRSGVPKMLECMVVL